jgi:outer membrane protein assembly factor BamB
VRDRLLYVLVTLLVALVVEACGSGAGSLTRIEGSPASGSPTAGAPPAATSTVGGFAGEGVVASLGRPGAGPGRISSPRGLALDDEGNLYVADMGNQRIQVFDRQGVFLTSISDPRFEGPGYVAVDDLGRIYVSDASDSVHLFDGRGEPLQSFGQSGSLPSQFSDPADLALDGAGDLYVVDTGNSRVQKFSLMSGVQFTLGDAGPETELLSRPQGIAVDASDNVYVGDAANGRILKYSSGGTFLVALDTGIGELREIAIDQQSYLYAVDGAESVVQVIDPQGHAVVRLGEGQLSDPWGVAVDESGRIYVSDAGYNRIVVLKAPRDVPTPVPQPTSVASPTPTMLPVEESSPWPMYGGDARHTGTSQVPGPVAPNLNWMFRAGLLANSPALGGDGTVLFGSLDGHLYALDAQGSELWRDPLGQMSGVPALSVSGTIYVGLASPVDGMFYALNRDGSEAWAYHIEGHIVEGSPVVGADGSIYLAASNPQTGAGLVVALSPEGTEKWRYDVVSRLPFSPAIGPEGTVYVGATNGSLYALNPDGGLNWQSPLNEVRSSPAVGADGTIYIATGGGYEAVEPGNGAVTWTFSPVDGEANSAPAVGPEGRVYVSSETKISALNQDGSVAWTFVPENRSEDQAQFTSPITIDGALVVYAGTRQGELFAINPDGSLRWRLQLPEGGMILVGPAIGSDGTLYVGAGSNLYAVGQ